MLILLKRALLVPLLLLLGATCAHAAAGELLPVEQAFKLETKVIDAQHVTLHWQIADNYYLYRDRIKLKSGDANLTLGALELGPATKKHDEYLGEVEVYHGTVDATQAITVANGATSTQLKVTVQGCHEVEPKICYPPFSQTIKLDIPTSAAATNARVLNSTNVLGADAANNLISKALAGNSAGNSVITDTSAPLPPEQAFVFETIATSPTEILARWTMPPGYYLYRDKSKVTLHGDGIGELGAARWPTGVQHTDTNFGTTTVYLNQVELPISLQRMNGVAQKISVDGEFQGCQENGICYPVMLRNVGINLSLASATQLADAKAAFQPAVASASGMTPDQALSEDQQLAAQLGTHSVASLGWFFVLGLLLAFTPCVFPMIPILSGIIAGAGENISTKRAFILSLVYVLASSVVFTIAGVIAGLAGKNLQAAFQNPWVLSSFAALFVLLSLSMFGFYELQLPSSWQTRLANVSNRQRSGSLFGVAVMGVLSALIIGPCVAPPLAAAVLYIGQAHDPVFGGLALFVLSLGMGAPLLAFGSAAGKLLPRAGAWMDAVKAVFGVLFIALAIWMLSRILDPRWIMSLGGALLIACAVYLGALEPLRADASGWRKLWKSLGVLLLIIGSAELLGAAAGGRDLLQPLKGIAASAGGTVAASTELPFKTIKSGADLDRELVSAQTQNKSLMLDFYADWCVSCKEMEHDTFAENSVHQALHDFILLKADVTANDDADQALMRRFAIIGPPGTLFFGKDGVEKRALRLTGPEAADKFVQRIAAAK